MHLEISVFKPWVPEWMIRMTLLLLLLPGLILFVLSISNINAAAGYYGISPSDAMYTCIIFYAAMASFGVLEARFFKFIASKEYMLVVVILLIVDCLLCYYTKSFIQLLILRYIQGLLTCGTLSITLTLMFNRLHSERTREIGFSVVYCVLLSVIPFSTFATASIIDAFNFNVIYKVAIYSYVPGAVLIVLTMNRVRLIRKVPLYQLDWASFILYTLGFCLVGYIAVYGQESEWLEDSKIRKAVISLFVLVVLFIIRQYAARRPYIHLRVFKERNFLVAAFLLFVLYICRGAFGVTTSFLGIVLGLDPMHIGYLMVYNVAAIIFAVIISSRLMIRKKSMRLILTYGFIILLVFHVRMCFLFTTEVDMADIIVPVILQGLGAGMLMAPIILFLVSSSPPKYGSTGSAIGILVRFSGFCSSIALINYFQMERQADHYNRFQDQLQILSPLAIDKLFSVKQSLIAKGMPTDHAVRAANGILNKGLAKQAQLRFAIDYYQMISFLLLAVLLIVILFPSINQTIIWIKSKRPSSSA